MSRWAAVLSMVGLLGTGCALNGGEGSDQPPPDSTSPAPQPAPERPRELALAGKPSAELCTLLSADQQAAVGVGRSSPLTGQDVGCGWLSLPGANPDVGVQIQSLPMELAQAVERSGDPFPETAATYTVQGFPAQQGQNGAGLEGMGCRVDVDVADGQTLEVFYTPTIAGSVANQDMCAKAKQAAEFAVTNLQAQG
ncbi:DUF3558 domain-containing protein [Saccharopolyspora sp. NFXS83]|uniref:DUF3558 domain-containing protein n=1 Tax=Saccharopolyspora sp. NFXS83 TaxID=2993560 RepID=UPI002B05F9FB|nr:DUF3558 domain-containing protein [Saccharopolyspora sp. NFXS83]